MKRSSDYIIPALLSICLLLSPSSGRALGAETGTSLSGAVSEAREAGVPDATLNALLALGYDKQIESAAMTDWVLILAETKREDIPLEPLVKKIEEGVIKRVPPPLIMKALARRLEDYRLVRSALHEVMRRTNERRDVPREYLMRLTETLYCGLTHEDLNIILSQAPPASAALLTRGIETMAALKQMRFDSRLSNQIVQTGLQLNYFTPYRGDLTTALYLAKEKGIPDASIADTAIEAMKSGASVEELSSKLGLSANALRSLGPQVGRSGEGGAGGHGAGLSGSSGHGSSGPGSGGGGSGGGGSGGGGSGGGGSGGGGSGGGGSGGGGSGGGGSGGGGSGGGGSGGGGSGGGGSGGGGSGGGGSGGGGSGGGGSGGGGSGS